MIRETAVLGREVVIGRGSGVAHGSRVGDRTRIQNLCLIGCRTVIEEDVTVGGRVTFIGDSTLARRDRDFGTEEISVGRRARIGTAAIIFPPCRIGEEAVVGAAAMVRADVPARTVVAGVPAVPLRLVRDDELVEVWAEHSDGGSI
jgi:serine O-acetyltransferase